MKELVSHLSIAAVEREVGISKDVLRVWERRYGFPSPSRDAHGERLYPAEQVRRLRLVKRLMDQGIRPGRLLGGPPGQLDALAADTGAAPPGPGSSPGEGSPDDPGQLLACIRSHDAEGLHRTLQQRLAEEGLASFVQDTMAPLALRVGDAWARGAVEVYEEHLFTEVASRLLRQALVAVPPGRAPVVLLTTVPEEAHGLGLLMLECLLCLRGARCINLGTQVPVLDIVRAAQAYRADVVALSFAASFSARRMPELLRQLRSSLPAGVQLWAGGAGVRRLSAPAGVRLPGSLGEAVQALAAWPSSAAPPPRG